MKILFEVFPVILFFGFYKYNNDIYLATKIAMASTLLQLTYAKLVLKKIAAMMWVSAGILIFFGGMTVIFRNSEFVKWKPTIIYWVMAAILLYSSLIKKKNLIFKLMSEQSGEKIFLPDFVWKKLNISWIVFFAVMGGVNIFVAHFYSEGTWVNFKLGSLAIPFLFAVGQMLFISKYIQEKDPE